MSVHPKLNDDQAREAALLSYIVRSQADTISCWNDVEQFCESLDGGPDKWCFRGQRHPEWSLVSSLEFLTSLKRRDAEDFLIREFQRSAHHFLRHLPGKDDVFEWLAVMQHHGTPTRLLDFTLSPYVGLYFALEQIAIDSVGDLEPCAALWAVNYVTCKGIALESISRLLQRSVDHAEELGDLVTFKKCFLESHRTYFVAPIRPRRYTKRQSVQQALFLCPSSVDLKFEEILVQPDDFHLIMGSSQPVGSIEHENEVRQSLPRLVRCAKITTAGARDIVRQLHRMNINANSLFPDIDGYARSVKEKLRTRRLLPPAEQQWNDYLT